MNDFLKPPPENETPEEKLSLAHLNYSTRPVLLDANQSFDLGILSLEGENLILKLTGQDFEALRINEITIPPDRQYSLIEPTLYGLNDALVQAEKGVSYRDLLKRELQIYDGLQGKGEEFKYGIYVYYLGSGNIVQYAPEEIHRLALVVSNSTLLLDPEKKMCPEEVREIFGNTVVAIAGASVGDAIAHAISMDLRPQNLKIADPANLKLVNLNRRRASYQDMVFSNRIKGLSGTPGEPKNKSIATASDIHAYDPFMNIFAYYEGLTEINKDSFVGGNRVEPKATFVIDEMDNPSLKVMLAETARKYGVRLVRATDAGSAVQIDIRPFDTNPQATLALGVSDEEVYEAQKRYESKPSRDSLFAFANCLIGSDYQRGELKRLIRGEQPKISGSVPQLGSTAMLAGAIVAEVVSRTVLGHRIFYERFMIDKQTLEILKWGNIV